MTRPAWLHLVARLRQQPIGWTVLIALFALQIVTAVGLASYFSLQNTFKVPQKLVEDPEGDVSATACVQEIHTYNRNAVLLVLLTLGTATVTGMIGAYWVRHSSHEREKKLRAILAQNQSLANILDALPSNVSVQSAEQILANYSRELEYQIQQRTIELAQINAQLHQEIQEREQAEAALRQSQHQLRNITDSVPAGIAYVDAERRYRFVNQVYENRFHRSREDMIGKYVWEIIGQETYEAVKDRIDQVLSGHAENVEFYITYDTGKTSYINTILKPDIDASGVVVGYHLVFFDITERKRLEDSLKQANDELNRLASLDGLTQIPNRRQFDLHLNDAWKRLARTHDMLSLILFDVDYFKPYNDYYGHQTGDDCLRQIAQATNHTVNRSGDLVARYGGEEFAVILPNTDQQGAIAIASRIQQVIWALAIPHNVSDIKPIVTVSMGIASIIPTPESEPNILISLADQSLYQAKQEGRDCFRVYEAHH